jgi:hypothetical protein
MTKFIPEAIRIGGVMVNNYSKIKQAINHLQPQTMKHKNTSWQFRYWWWQSHMLLRHYCSLFVVELHSYNMENLQVLLKIRIRKSKKNRQHNLPRKWQMYIHRSTKHTHNTKDRVTGNPLKIGGKRRCSGRISNSCSTSGKSQSSRLSIDTY